VMPNTPPADLASIHAALVAGLENGMLRPVIGKEFSLAEAPQASRSHGARSVWENRAGYGEVRSKKYMDMGRKN
jgi:hypothetical protein